MTILKLRLVGHVSNTRIVFISIYQYVAVFIIDIKVQRLEVPKLVKTSINGVELYFLPNPKKGKGKERGRGGSQLDTLFP